MTVDTDVLVPAHGHEYASRLPAGKDANEVAGFVVTGRTADENVLFWSCAYVMEGEGVNQWIDPHARAQASIFFSVPRGQTGMADNDFVRGGLQPTEYLTPDDLKITTTEHEASWEIAGRRYVWRQGEWRIEGEHLGVGADLTCRPAAPPLWTFGPFESIEQMNMAGYDCVVSANGSVTAGGKTFEIHDGFGSHERAIVGEGRDIMNELAKAEVFVGDCYVDGVHLFWAKHPGRPIAFGRVSTASDAVMFPNMETMQGEVQVEVTERWHDPRSGLYVPARLSVSMSGPDASAELEIVNCGRAYWHYTTRSGVMMLMWTLGRANGTVTVNGETKTITDALVPSRWGVTIFVNQETLDGQKFPVLEDCRSA